MLESYKIANDVLEEIDKAGLKGFLEGAEYSGEAFVWIDIVNAPEKKPSVDEAEIMQDLLHLHPLVIEDCITKKHLPKFEEHEGYHFFIISKMTDVPEDELDSNKICFVIGEKFILTYSNVSIPEISAAKKLVKSNANDFKTPVDVFYLITDQVIDDYVTLIENTRTKIYEIEELVFERPNASLILKEINFIRKNHIILRRNTLMQKQIFSNLIPGNVSSQKYTGKSLYFKDICDHLEKVLAKIDNQKEYIGGILNIQSGLSNQKLNNLIKFLTVISAVLLPSTLIASIFGMNFADLPMASLKEGFYIIISIMFVFGVSTFIFFYNKKWL